MDHVPSLDELLLYLVEVFPSLSARRDLQERSHQEWVEMRRHLPRLVPEDVVAILPFVLADMARTADRLFESGDMVVYFLDVWAEPFDAEDPSIRALIEKFADEEIRGEAGKRFKANMLSKTLGSEGLPKEERHEQERCQREASFAMLATSQRHAVYWWLRYLDGLLRTFDDGRIQLFDEMALARAIIYWNPGRLGEGDTRQ